MDMSIWVWAERLNKPLKDIEITYHCNLAFFYHILALKGQIKVKGAFKTQNKNISLEQWIWKN